MAGVRKQKMLTHITPHIFFLVSLLLVLFGGGSRGVAAIASPFDGKSFAMCMLWWSNVGDNGYTDRHQDGLINALSRLRSTYPFVEFSAHIQYDVFSSDDQLGAYRKIRKNPCNLVYFAFSDLYASRDWIIREARASPQILFGVGDLRVGQGIDLPRNMVVAEPICDREWYLAGLLAGALTHPGSPPVMTVAFANATGYATHAFSAGFARSQPYFFGANATNPDIFGHTKPIVVPLNSWYAADVETAIAELALNNTNCTVMTHFTDPFAVSTVANTMGKYSIGWGHDFSNFYGSSVLTTVIRIYGDQFFNIVSNWMFNISRPRQVYDCILTNIATTSVNESVRRYIQDVNATLNMSVDVWSDPVYFSSSGEPMLAGPLSRFDVGTISFISNFSIQNEDIVGPVGCPSNTEGSYALTDGTSFSVTCTTCAVGFFSRNGDPCAECVGDYVSFCGNPRMRGVVKLVVGLVVGVGGALLVAGGLITWYCSRRATLLKRRIKEQMLRQPMYVDPPTNHDGGSVDAALAIEQIAAGRYELGARLFTAATGVHAYKCLLHQGGTVCMYEYAHRRPEDAVRLAASLVEVTQHPNLVRVYGVLHNSESGSMEMFCEMTSGGTLHDLLAETHGRLPEITTRSLIAQLLRGVEHLHSLHRVHRSISSTQVMLTSSGVPKLFCGPLVAEIASNSDASLTVVASTSFVSPPEVLLGMCDVKDAFDAACRGDVWMLGVLAAELLHSGQSPWPREVGDAPSAVISHILAGGGPSVPPYSSTAAAAFVASATSHTASQRPSAAELLAHPWLISKSTSGTNSSSDDSSNRSGRDLNDGNILTPSSQHVSNDNNNRAAPSLYRVSKLLGVGSFGTVHLVIMLDGTELAMKTISYDTSEAESERRFKKVKDEFKEISGISHPNIVKYVSMEEDIPTAVVPPVGVFSTTASSPFYASFPSHTGKGNHQQAAGALRGKHGYPTGTTGNSRIVQVRIFMEVVSGGTLKQYAISKGGRLPVTEVAAIAFHMSQALLVLHSRNIVHRDVKPSNFLYSGPPTYVKLADFGSAMFASSPGSAADRTATSEMQGTLLYMAPELLKEEVPTSAADIWSLGATVLELCTGSTPWSHVFGPTAPVIAVVAYVCSSEPLSIPSTVPDLASSFLKCCLRRDPTQRSTAQDLLRHPWIAQISN